MHTGEGSRKSLLLLPINASFPNTRQRQDHRLQGQVRTTYLISRLYEFSIQYLSHSFHALIKGRIFPTISTTLQSFLFGAIRQNHYRSFEARGGISWSSRGHRQSTVRRQDRESLLNLHQRQNPDDQPRDLITRLDSYNFPSRSILLGCRRFLFGLRAFSTGISLDFVFD